jgi:hypothetical protein
MGDMLCQNTEVNLLDRPVVSKKSEGMPAEIQNTVSSEVACQVIGVASRRHVDLSLLF